MNGTLLTESTWREGCNRPKWFICLSFVGESRVLQAGFTFGRLLVWDSINVKQSSSVIERTHVSQASSEVVLQFSFEVVTQTIWRLCLRPVSQVSPPQVTHTHGGFSQHKSSQTTTGPYCRARTLWLGTETVE
ncbi:hypothetical protein GE061_006460 [Apolygus lucorum]|uniref:Uncharacterized protein n=1 Tax=Apolygus lucorum TaxID=248454 RepID=A0A8S9WVB3_APOLU|nr:hypothetical protein GE061_006460 [Apolygus lucorum]